MSLSIAKFIDGLSQIGLLPPAEIEALKAAQADKLEADADGLARELVEQGKLSRFQAAAVYQGRAEALVLGNYLVIDKLGAGGMGQVFRARHRRMDRVVALKVLSKKQLGSPEAVARFQREVKAAARLTHPHIVTAYDADEAAGMLYLVMEYVEGQDLSAIVKAGGPLSVPQAVDYVIQAARGLEHAHSQGIIHRDVKPSNLLLDKQGTVKVLDMGLARVDNPLGGPDSGEGLTAAGSVMGTVDFMSPEQALDTAHADARSDIYSLGCTLYYLLSSKKPYDGDTAMKKLVAHREKPIPSLAEARPEVSADLEAVYRKLVAKRPENRYATMREAREALEAVQAGRRPLGGSGQASPVPMAARLSEQPKESIRSSKKAKAARSKTPLIAVTVAALVMLGVGGWLALKMLSKGGTEEVALADALPKPTANKPIAKHAGAAIEPNKPAATKPESNQRATSEPASKPAEPVSAAPPAEQAAPSAPMDAPATEPAGQVVAPSTNAAAEPAPETDVPAPPADPALERKAAEWVLGVGGRLEIWIDGRTLQPTRIEQLPAEPFNVWSADLAKLPQVDDQSLANLDGLSHLVRLVLSSTSISNAAAAHIAGHPHLRVLNFPGTAFSDAGFDQLPATIPLNAIQANGALITDRGAQSIARFKRLTGVYLVNTAVGDDGVRWVSQLPLERLNLNGTAITDVALKHLQNCKSLVFLSLERTAITDAGIALLPQLPSLRELQIRETRITATSADVLAGMKALTLLSVSEPPMIPAEYEKLRAALPNCRIEVVASRAPPVVAVAPKTVLPLNTANRISVPADSEQQAAAKLVNDVYGEEIAQAKKPEDKSAVATRLLKKADETRDEPAAAYVLLDLARGLAVDAGDAPLLVKINQALGSRFEVEPLGLLADDLEKSVQKPHPAVGFRAISDLALEHVDDALAADDFALAKRFSDAALAAGRKAKDPLVLKYALERSKSLAAAKTQWDAAEEAKSTLAKSPDDPEANLVLGRFLCFVKGDWDAGFALLAKGSDDTLKELAAKSVANPQDAAAQSALGEAWANAADAAKGKSKAELQAGAKYWLAQAAPALTGLAKAKVEQRLKQIAPATGSAATVSTASSKPARRPAGNMNQQLARDRAAAEWVLGLRGKIGITPPGSSERKTVELASDLPAQPFFLTTVDLSSVKELTDDSLRNLEGLANLQELRLHRTRIGDAGMVHLKDLTGLQFIDLSSSPITDAGIAQLNGLTNLAELRLLHAHGVTGTALEALKGLKNLSKLVMSDTRVDDSALVHLKNFPKLEMLRLPNTQVTDAGLDQIRTLSLLKDLELSRTKITEVGLPKLYGLRNLKALFLYEFKFSDAAIKKLQAALPQCKLNF